MSPPRKITVLGTILAALFLAGSAAAQAPPAREPPAREPPAPLALHLRDLAGSPAHQGAEHAAATLEALSGGRLRLAVATSRGLGTFDGLLRGLGDGTVDLTLFPASALGPFVPRAAVLETPLVVRDYAHLQAIHDSPWGRALHAELRQAHGWRVLDSWYLDTRHVTARRPLATAADFQGLRLRVPNAKLMIDFARAIGATPTSLALTALPEALASGALDAQEDTLATIDALKLHEVQSHLVLTGHLIQDQLVLISEPTWQRLAAADRRLLRIAVLSGGIANNAAAIAREAAIVDTLVAAGMTVTGLDQTALRAAMQPVYEALEAEFGAGIVRQLMALE